MKSKHVPQRTCVNCRSAQAKRELIRLVRSAGGEVAVDPTGRRNGRGAYLCARVECWSSALKRGRLASALRASISKQDMADLLAYAEGLANSELAGVSV